MCLDCLTSFKNVIKSDSMIEFLLCDYLKLSNVSSCVYFSGAYLGILSNALFCKVIKYVIFVCFLGFVLLNTKWCARTCWWLQRMSGKQIYVSVAYSSEYKCKAMLRVLVIWQISIWLERRANYVMVMDQRMNGITPQEDFSSRGPKFF